MERAVTLPTAHGGASLADVIDRILDKGVVINADITVSVVGVELLGLRIRAAIASFETAAAYGLEFPSGTRLPASVGVRDSPLPIAVGGNGNGNGNGHDAGALKDAATAALLWQLAGSSGPQRDGR